MIPLSTAEIHRVAAAIGIDPTVLSHLGGGREDSDGITYSYPAGSGERVLKILSIQENTSNGIARLNERLKFASFLGKHGVDIVFPLEQPGGSLVTTLPGDGHLLAAYCMEKIPGHHPAPEEWTPEFHQRWGRAIGRLHRVTQNYPTWQHSINPEGKPFFGWREEWQGFYDLCADAQVKDVWEAMRLRLDALPCNRSCYGFVHNDPHIQNLLYAGQRIVLLDFDVANYHWFACEFAIACQAMLFAQTGGMERPLVNRQPLLEFIHDFRIGYEAENQLDPFWWEQIDLFIQYRRLLLFTVMQGWLETVPETRNSWKEMILRDPPLTRS